LKLFPVHLQAKAVEVCDELNVWRDRGYNTFVMEGTRLHTLQPPEKMNSWKKLGEDTLQKLGLLVSLIPTKESQPDAIKTPAPQPETIPDGPIPPKTLVWQGNRIETVEPTPLKLLNYLWTTRRAKVADTERQVWGEESNNDSRLKSAIAKANKALAKVKCPLQIHKSSDWLTIE
jgi:hypothetical protein